MLAPAFDGRGGRWEVGEGVGGSNREGREEACRCIVLMETSGSKVAPSLALCIHKVQPYLLLALLTRIKD